ncbi:MAG: AI-2E family transporter [Bacteroidota bacterium]|nr:AI-2E family transporter [Kiloniellaceae bacterium]
MSQNGSETPRSTTGGAPRVSMASQLRFWLILLLVTLVCIYLLRSVLLPFVAGMAVAYLLDPVCDRLERWKMSRTWATVVVTVCFVLVCVLVLLLIIPLVVSQAADFAERLPQYAAALEREARQLIDLVRDRLDPASEEKLRSLMGDTANKVFGWLADVIGGIVSGGVAFFNFIALLVITPVVAFYLLRDWDRMVAKADDSLPRKHQRTIRQLAREVDDTLAGFLRGQGTVCLSLAVFYAVGLTLAGLDFGLVIGLIAGFLSFIPYVGSLVGLLLSVGLAVAQFDSWVSIAIVAGVFFVGQAIEGNVLTPKLVGDRVGLHPVWVMFALLAGGALFGFVGVLLAVPVAAVVGVGVRFAFAQYRASPFYTGYHGMEEPGKGDPSRGPDATP